MATYRLSQRARRDLVEIWSYIAGDNEGAADGFIDLLVDTFRIIGQNPHLGRIRDDLHKHYRSFAVGQYVIVYRIAEPGVQVLHILHGKRDIPKLLRQ